MSRLISSASFAVNILKFDGPSMAFAMFFALQYLQSSAYRSSMFGYGGPTAGVLGCGLWSNATRAHRLSEASQ